MIVRRVADGAAIALCLSVLTGCIFTEGITSGLTTVKRDGANILVAACADTVATRMTFSEQSSAIEEGDERFWAFEREIELRRGDVLSSDPAVTPPVPGEIRRTPLLLPDDRLYVSFSNQDDSVLEISGYFHLPSEGFSESKWLHEDGTLTDDPCEGIPDRSN